MRSSLNQTLSDHVPHKRTRPKPSLPWVDYETKKFIRRRDRVHKHMKKSGDETFKQEFKTLKRLVQKLLCRAYWRYAEGLISDDGESQTTPKKKFRSFIKARRTEAVGVSPLKEAGKLISEPKEQARILNTQLHSVFSPKDTITAEEFELRCPPGPNLPDYPSCGDISITEDGVRKLLLNLNPNKACGPDGITPRLLKMVTEELTPALTLLYRISYLSGTLPKDWKQANITPVFEKGEKYNAANYRPISLTCVACKLMEHIITSHIMSHLEKNEILCPEQHGFRRGHSCETQLLGYVYEATREIEKGNQEDTIVLDFSRAFDKVSHTLLIHKLQRYGIRGRTNAWIKDFLTDRQQAVVVEGTRSDPLPVESGVPQGSVLGPSLFSAIHQRPPRRHQVKDPPICRRHHVQQDEQVLQEDLRSLTTWEEKWSMEFHPQKCSTLRVSRKKDKTAPGYELHGQNIENVSTTKYMGVNIQDNMQWESHIDSITKKASKTLGFIRCNLKIDNKKTKETAYKALVRPLLEYAAPVWDAYTANDEIEALEKIQQRAARWVTSRHRQTSCVDSILEQLDWPPLQLRARKPAWRCSTNFTMASPPSTPSTYPSHLRAG